MIPASGVTSSRMVANKAPVARASSSRTIRRTLTGTFGAAGLIIVAANTTAWQRFLDLAQGPDEKVLAEEKQSAEIAKLIEETKVDEVARIAEGEDAIAQNEALPVSGLPVDPARPFHLPTVSAAQETNAERCLTQAIYYEAATEPDSGKAAVAQVILNRLRHPAFPRTVCGVVYQGSDRPGCQFSFTCDGSLRRAPLPSLWRRAQEIARAALKGHVVAKVGMATHYHANYVFPYWAPKLTKIDQIGAHIFYRWPGSWGKPAAFSHRYGGEERIPLLSELYQRIEMADGDTDLDDGRVTLRSDPTDRRADNDVGGRIDPTKGWTPKLPELTQMQSRYQAMTSQQASQAVAPTDGE